MAIRSRLSVREFYDLMAEAEASRLGEGLGRLEFERTRRLLERFLPPPPVEVLDVGGGPGAYSFWLAERGFRVHLVEPSPRLAGLARIKAANRPDAVLAGIHESDARSLPFDDASARVLLLFGPLYHLTEAADRALALAEAYRVLTDDGILFAAAISRFASAVDGWGRDFVADPAFVEIMRGDLDDGRHRNPTDNPLYFTDAYFQRPEDLDRELADAGFPHRHLFAVEGLAPLVRDFDATWEDPVRRELLLDTIERTETEPSLMGLSPHLLAVAHKQL